MRRWLEQCNTMLSGHHITWQQSKKTKQMQMPLKIEKGQKSRLTLAGINLSLIAAVMQLHAAVVAK